MADKEKDIMDVCGCNRQTAKILLEMAGSVEAAVNMYWEDPGIVQGINAGNNSSTSLINDSAMLNDVPIAKHEEKKKTPAKEKIISPTKHTQKTAPSKKFGSMEEILEENENEEKKKAKRENYFNGGASRSGGSNTRQIQPGENDDKDDNENVPHNLNEMIEKEKEEKNYFTIVIHRYNDGFILNRHLPFYKLSEPENANFLKELGNGVYDPKFNKFLPENERPSTTNKEIRAELSRINKDFDGELPKVEVKDKDSQIYHEFDPKKNQTETASFDELASKCKVHKLGEVKAAPLPVRNSAVAPTTNNVKPTEPELYLNPKAVIEPIRIKTNVKSYTLKTNPDKHTLHDILVALHKAGVNVSSKTGFKLVTPTGIRDIKGSDIKRTIKALDVSKKQLCLYDFE